jgi:hypothetical protein
MQQHPPSRDEKPTSLGSLPQFPMRNHLVLARNRILPVTLLKRSRKSNAPSSAQMRDVLAVHLSRTIPQLRSTTMKLLPSPKPGMNQPILSSADRRRKKKKSAKRRRRKPRSKSLPFCFEQRSSVSLWFGNFVYDTHFDQSSSLLGLSY